MAEPTTCHAATIGFECARPVQPEHTPCCSSHGRALCCFHYGRWHFCEGVCSPGSHAGTEQAPRDMP